MKYCQVSLLFFLFSFCSTNAQNFSINWTDDEKQVENYSDAVELNNGNYLLLKILPKKGFTRKDFTANPVFVLTDPKIHPIREVVYEIAENDDTHRELKKIGGEVYLMYKVSHKGQSTFYAIRIDQETLQAREKKILVTVEGDQFDLWPEIKTAFSPDSSHLLLFVEGFGSKKENKQIYIGVYDRDLKRVWGRYQEFAISTRSVSIEDYAISNEGNVYLAAKHYEKDLASFRIIGKGPKIPPYQYKLFVYSKAGRVRQIDVALAGHYIAGTKLRFEKNGITRLAGLYSKNPSGHIPGAFYTSFDSLATTIKVTELLPFPEDLLNLVTNDKQGKSSGSDPGVSPWLRINHIIVRKNETVDIISEVQKVDEHAEKEDGVFYGHITYSYDYGDIINISMPKQSPPVFRRIPKTQETSYTTRGLSYFPTLYGNNLLLFYNDIADNLTKDISRSPGSYLTSKRNAVLVAAIIDDKFNITRNPVYNFRDEKRVTLPLNFIRLSNGKIFLISAWGGGFASFRLGFGILEIK